MTIYKRTQIKGVIVLFLITLIPLIFGLLPSSFKSFDNSIENEITREDSDLGLGLPPTTYDWWNNSWNFRVPVGITAIGGQQDAPVEFFINFTEYFNDLNIQNPELNTSTIRVVEYLSGSNYYEVESQFDPYSRSYDSQTNAIGDLIWVLNGTTSNGQTRDFFIYFNNGTDIKIQDPNYDTIRIWHEGFEEYQPGDILRPTDGQDNYHPTFWEISNSTSARGTSSLHIWGNCWKMSATGSITVNSNTRVTAKMRFDDPSIQREISGIGFDDSPNNIPTSGNSYRIRGSQSWGTAGGNKFVNQFYAANTFFWYTFIPSTEFSLNPFTYIVYIADDDSWTNLDLYWDDISIWNKPIQTTPNNSLQTTLGDIQPIAYTLNVICKDEDGNPVPNAQIYLTNDLFPSYNQNHEADENGEWTFEDLEKDAFYNITVNYTQNGLITPKTEIVFYYENFQITQLNNRLTAFLTLSKFTFNVTDKDNNPIQYGFVLLKSGVEIVGKTILSIIGTGSITWLNNTAYDYEIYYDYDSLVDNSNYRYSNLLIYSDSVLGKDIDVSTEITKITFNVTDNTAEKVPFTNAKLRFYNQTDYDNENEIIANVTVDINGLATFISFSNSYGSWGNYTMDIYFGGFEQDFLVNPPSASFHEYNFILISEEYVSIEILTTNRDKYNSTVNIINYDSNVYWGNIVSINFNFTYRDPVTPSPTLVTPDELIIQIFDGELTQYSTKIDILFSEISTGIFNYTFNTDDFNLLGGTSYYFKITGNYESYLFNDIGFILLNIQAVPTGINYYDYSLNPLINKRFSVIYEESEYVTVDYFNVFTSSSLPGAYITYSWDYGSGVLIDDPIHVNMYYFEFDSSLAPDDAEYLIDIRATLSNYSTIDDSIIVKILPRPTSINGTTSLFQISPDIHVFDSVNYLFEYKDILRDVVIGDLDVASYNWYRLDEDGNPLSGPGNEGSDVLLPAPNNQYMLDFDTELREVGLYSIFITMQKNNYEVRNAFIALTISKRPILMDLYANGVLSSRISIIQGRSINFSAILTDGTNGSALTGANVRLQLNGINYTLDPVLGSPGTYQYIFSTSHINAFFMPQTLTGQIIIELENYEIDPEPITVIVNMPEILGIPAFYFLMIVGSIIA
ncbi:MAG: carboxypeptidase-like regulatory domain-containing protein, partial [Promethearchaeota archaeon]